MQIRMLTAMASSEGWSYRKGRILTVGKEVSREAAEAWVAARIAALVKEIPERAEEPEPETAEVPRSRRGRG